MENVMQNPNCDGSRCRTEIGPVKIYPLGGGANLILCHTCWTHENRYRFERGLACGEPNNFPQVDWGAAETYQNNGSPLLPMPEFMQPKQADPLAVTLATLEWSIEYLDRSIGSQRCHDALRNAITVLREERRKELGQSCDCGHGWIEHARTDNGAYACRHHGCGCRDVVMP
jgi:hypothetical protein